MRAPHRKLGELLIATGAVTASDVDDALKAQKGSTDVLRLGERLVALGKVTPELVSRALAEQFELPFVELPEIPSRVTALFPLELQAQHRMLPFRYESEGAGALVHLAIADPTKLDMIEELRLQLGKPIRVYVAAWDDIDSALAALMSTDSDSVLIEDDETAAPAAAPADPFQLPEEWAIAPLEKVAKTVAAQSAPGATEPTPWLDQPTPAQPIPAPVPARANGKAPSLPTFSESDLQVLEALEHLAAGGAAPRESSKVKPSQLVASLIRLLMKKGVIDEAELLEELGRK